MPSVHCLCRTKHPSSTPTRAVCLSSHSATARCLPRNILRGNFILPAMPSISHYLVNTIFGSYQKSCCQASTPQWTVIRKISDFVLLPGWKWQGWCLTNVKCSMYEINLSSILIDVEHFSCSVGMLGTPTNTRKKFPMDINNHRGTPWWHIMARQRGTMGNLLLGFLKLF